MANLSISGIRERIFNNTKHEQTVARSSNPFAQTSFKGNVLTADVFESSKEDNKNENKNQPSFTGKIGAIPAKSKLYLSAMVGSINNFGDRMAQKWHSGVESIVSFCGRISDNISNFWNEMKHTEVKLDILDNMKDALRPGIRKNDIAKMDLSIEDNYKSLHSMLSEKATAWADSLVTA